MKTKIGPPFKGGPITVTFTITGTVGNTITTSETVTITLNINNPCQIATLSIDPLIINTPIEYGIHASSDLE